MNYLITGFLFVVTLEAAVLLAAARTLKDDVTG
jgi:hypothetical protein